ncbi:MAG: hypothetical protein CMD14_06015 [Flavobacteriales bacterium]|nr:hypothetical protein [Flavobacteriales bacterium]|tara:strand:- start:33301 stop:37587 length:4287 start_codon:yes stop_codon:yes gene_type:complete
MNNHTKNIITLSLAFFSIALIAKENVDNLNTTTSSVVNSRVAAGCSPSTSQTDLDVNNVRTIIMGGGDMWWNLSDARYEIPKDGNKHSMFAGALWIGGVDDGGQLKVAAMTYRQGGNDFWPGPLNITNATISADECSNWDQHFKLERSDVEEYVARFNVDPTYVVPQSILSWPAHGINNIPSPGQDYYLAPFFDANGNGEYEPSDGDYPDYNITGSNTDAKLFGDQTLFWIFNDKGNIHTETEAEPLGLEIHAQAFGFAADNEVNDMTFYNYKIINRSTLPLNDTYFGQWVDPDLGYYLDDYVGCDVSLGLGFCYNGDAEDEGAAGYGFNPPAIGVDFFQGPIADAGDGIDNDRDGVIDEPNEQIIMSKFVYYNNDFTVTGNPENGTDIYNYLRGIWKDNVPMTYGGDGHGSGTGSTTNLCNFMFPGTSDADFPGQEWTEVTAGNVPADRRFLQSAGPFTLEPGAVNTITTGVVWARAKSGGQTASIQLLKIYDREAQALFDNNFNILNGPDAPDLYIRELDKELIFTLSNGGTSNNIDESYIEKDPYITKPANLLTIDSAYTFQGYLVYQLKDATVSVTDLDDPDRARLIFRSDIKDDVTGIVNQYLDPILGVYTPVEEVQSQLSEGVIGSVDEGVEFSFQITDDKFALGNTRLVNHKTYYFMSLAYGYNRAEENASPYAVNDTAYDGRNQPYISGRRNIKVYSAIPHFTEPENGGMTLNASYGDGVELKRQEGQGNGGIALELTNETVNEILNSSDHRSLYPTYKQGKGPIEITVVDPVSIPQGDFTFKLMNPTLTSSGAIISYGRWELLNDELGSIVAFADEDILVGNEQYISSLGLNIKVSQSANPGTDPENIDNNGFISGTIEFDNINDRWLSGVADRDDESEFFSLWGFNWIRAGSNVETSSGDPVGDHQIDYTLNDDPNGIFEGAVVQTNVAFGNFEWSGGTWAPYRCASWFNDGPGITNSITNLAKLENLNSIDIVITDDTSKWSRVCVVEAQDDTSLAEGGQIKMGLRQSLSVGKDGLPDGALDQNGDLIKGMGWFPGYAIDIETGERLNIIFSEDSWQTSENGNDMLWNPTGKLTTDEFPQFDANAPVGQQFSGGNYLLGGKHFIYIVKGESWVKGTEDYINNISNCDDSPNYDESAWIYSRLLNDNNGTGKFYVFKNVTWVGAPLLAPGRELNLSNTATVKLRVDKSYKQYETVVPYIDYNNDLVITDNEVIIKDKNINLTQGNTYVVAYQNAATTWGGKTVTYNGIVYQPGETFVATSTPNFTGSTSARVIEANSLNSFNPTYSFSTDNIIAEKGNINVALDAMETIKVVPNPYYGYSSYEINQLDNRVKITNLPQIASVKIFTVSGTLVRTIRKDDSMTSIDWDLKNDFGIPIASGLYIIHVRASLWDDSSNKYVEKDKVIKWFGALRPIDLDTF